MDDQELHSLYASQSSNRDNYVAAQERKAALNDRIEKNGSRLFARTERMALDLSEAEDQSMQSISDYVNNDNQLMEASGELTKEQMAPFAELDQEFAEDIKGNTPASPPPAPVPPIVPPVPTPIVQSYVASGAKMICPFAMGGTSALVVTPDRRTSMQGPPKANIMDNKPMVNIPTFGVCSSLANPQVAAATAAAMGVLTPQPCIPNIVAPWAPGKANLMIQGQPALLNTDTLQCLWGGVITIMPDPSTHTGSAPVKPPKPPKLTSGIVLWTASTSNDNGSDGENGGSNGEVSSKAPFKWYEDHHIEAYSSLFEWKFANGNLIKSVLKYEFYLRTQAGHDWINSRIKELNDEIDQINGKNLGQTAKEAEQAARDAEQAVKNNEQAARNADEAAKNAKEAVKGYEDKITTAGKEAEAADVAEWKAKNEAEAAESAAKNAKQARDEAIDAEIRKTKADKEIADSEAGEAKRKKEVAEGKRDKAKTNQDTAERKKNAAEGRKKSAEQRRDDLIEERKKVLKQRGLNGKVKAVGLEEKQFYWDALEGKKITKEMIDDLIQDANMKAIQAEAEEKGYKMEEDKYKREVDEYDRQAKQYGEDQRQLEEQSKADQKKVERLEEQKKTKGTEQIEQERIAEQKRAEAERQKGIADKKRNEEIPELERQAAAKRTEAGDQEGIAKQKREEKPGLKKTAQTKRKGARKAKRDAKKVSKRVNKLGKKKGRIEKRFLKDAKRIPLRTVEGTATGIGRVAKAKTAVSKFIGNPTKNIAKIAGAKGIGGAIVKGAGSHALGFGISLLMYQFEDK